MSLYKNILLINFGGIGDEILFLPVVDSIRTKYPKSKLTLCLESRSAAFLKLTKSIDNHLFADIKTKNKYIQMLKLYFKILFGKYDLVISSGASPLIALMLFFTGIKTRVGYATSSITKKLLTHHVQLNKNQYAAKMYFDLVKPITNDEFKLPKIEVDEQEKIKNSVLIHPGVSKISVNKNIIKIFGAEIWAQLIKELLNAGKKVYLVGGSDDTQCIEKIRNHLKNEDLSNFTDLFGQTKNIYDLALIIKKSEVLICSDSAPMHIGVATDTKTIAIFGATDEKKLLPISEKFTAITNNANCRPCLWDKRQTTCEELKCLDIDLGKIISKV